MPKKVRLHHTMFWNTSDEVDFIKGLRPEAFVRYAQTVENRKDWKGLDKQRVLHAIARLLPLHYKRYNNNYIIGLD